MDDDGIEAFKHFGDLRALKRLKPHQVALVVLAAIVFLLLPILAVEFHLPPAVWLNSQQSQILGGYYFPKLTFVLLMLFYVFAPFIIVSLITLPLKFVTGKTVLELLCKKDAERKVRVSVTDENGDEHAKLRIRQEWINQQKSILVTLTDGRRFRLQLSEAMRSGTRLRMKGKASRGGDLYLHIQI
jgi:hypothetical protein